jgi:POT family proton-dependent oligopeptide transporter
MSFFGHPKGLAYLAFTEMWERFSYYGMTALLVLYMVQELLLPGHIENVAGMAVLRGTLERAFGTLSTQALASMVLGLYGGLVYLTPIIGGWLADRWFGAKRMVLIGVFLMTAGHAAMVFEQSFLVALLLLILGSGALKGNIAAQVGQLYELKEESKRSRGFTIFSTFINVGALIGPLVCGFLAQVYGWHYGFGIAGLLMLVACTVYLKGAKYLPDERPKGLEKTVYPPLSTKERITILLMLPIFVVNVLGHAVYFQSINVGLIWISEHVQLDTFMGTVPTPWFSSVDPLAAIIAAPIIVILWRAQSLRGTEPSDLGKIGIAMAFMASAMLIFSIGSHLAGDSKTSILWPVIAYIFSGVGFLWYWPTTLAFVSRRAPKSINAIMLGIIYLSLFFASFISGYIATFYESLGPTIFFLINAALPLAAALFILLFGGKLTRAFDANKQD